MRRSIDPVELILKARAVEMTDEERREQRASIVFGQLALMKERQNMSASERAKLRAVCRRMAGCAAEPPNKGKGR